MSVNGGSDRIKYFMSLGYLHDEGMYDGIDYKRYNLRANIDAKINNYINVRLDLGRDGEYFRTTASRFCFTI